MSKFEGKNLAAIREAIDQHNASCPVPGNAILLNPVDHQLIGWDELWGLPVISDDRVPTKRVRIQCDGSAFGIEDEVADAVAREQPIDLANKDWQIDVQRQGDDKHFEQGDQGQ